MISKKINILFIFALMLSISSMAGKIKFDKAENAVSLDGISNFITVGDINKDSKDDIVVSMWPKGTHIFLKKDGKYPQKADYVLNKDKACGGTIIKDLNGDKVNDLAINSFTDKFVLIFDGQKALENPEKIYNTNISRVNQNMQVAKLIPSEPYSFVTGSLLRTKTKDGTFKATYIYGPKINDNFLPAIADLDSDGKLDIVFGGWKNKTIRAYGGPVPAGRAFKIGHASFFYEFPVGEKIQSVAVIDINNDERNDIIYSTKDGVFAIIQQSPAGFDNKQKAENIFKAPNAKLFKADMNKDEIDDLIMLADGNIYIFSGAESIKGKTLTDANSHIKAKKRHIFRTIAVKDINKDGLVDIIAGEFRGKKSNILILKQQK
jgi:hypothetical protein